MKVVALETINPLQYLYRGWRSHGMPLTSSPSAGLSANCFLGIEVVGGKTPTLPTPLSELEMGVELTDIWNECPPQPMYHSIEYSLSA